MLCVFAVILVATGVKMIVFAEREYDVGRNPVLAFVLATLVVAPFQTEIADRLAVARAPQAVVAEIGACARAAVPALAERLSGDWQWVVARTVGIWIGTTTADAVLAEAVPQCRAALVTARPFLAGPNEA